MSIENIKNNFEIYVQNLKGGNEEVKQQSETSNESNFNIFDFAEEFKSFVEDGYMFSNSINSLSKEDINELEIFNGVLTTKEDRKITQEQIKTSSSILIETNDLFDNEKASFEDGMKKEETNEETIVSLLKELAVNEEFISKLDNNQDSKLDNEEFKNFIKNAQKIDGNDKNLSLTDLINGIDAINKDIELSTIISKEKAIKKDTKETQNKNMSIEELKDEGYEELKETLDKAKDVISGDNSTLKTLHKKVDEVYNVFQEKLQEESPRLAKEHEEIRNEISKRNKEINKNRKNLLQEKTLLKNSENSYANIHSRTKAYKEKLSELKDAYKNEVDAKTKEEISKHINMLKEKIEITEAKEKEIKEKIELRKTNINNLKTKIETLKEDKKVYNKEKKELEEKIKNKYPETEKYLEYYNTAVSHYKEEKISMEDKYRNLLSDAQENCNKNKTKYSNEIEKTTLKKCKLRKYCSEAGQKLLNNSINVEKEMAGTGKCLTAVKSALKRAYPEFSNLISNTEGYYSAYQFAKALSGEDKRFAEFSENFKEIECSTNNIKDLPAGAIVVYSANYSKRHGHIAIMDGKGNQYSDWKGNQSNLTNYYQTNFWNKGSTIRVFVPIS